MTSFDLTNLLPKDLTPAQRAGLKFAFHIAIMAVSAALLAGYSVASSANGAINWRLLAIVAGSQAFLAIADTLKKYFSARGDLSISTMIDIAQSQLAAKAPPVTYTADQEALKQVIANLLSNTATDPESTAKLPIVPKPTTP